MVYVEETPKKKLFDKHLTLLICKSADFLGNCCQRKLQKGFMESCVILGKALFVASAGILYATDIDVVFECIIINLGKLSWKCLYR